MVLSISRPCLGLRIGLLSRLLSSWVSLGGMVWFGCFLGGCLLLTVHCLLIYSNQTGVPAYTCGIFLDVCLFVYSCILVFCLFVLVIFFSLFVRFLGFYVSSWRLIFIYCLSREPCFCFPGFCYLASLLACPSMTFHSHSSLCRCHARRWHSMVQ